MSDAEEKQGVERGPRCPECNGTNLRFGYDEDFDWTYCDDCEKKVEKNYNPKIPKGANGPGTYQWQAAKRRGL